MSLFDGLLNKAPTKTVDATTYNLDVAPIITTGPSTPVATTQDIVMAPVTTQVATIVEPPMVTPVEISEVPSETPVAISEEVPPIAEVIAEVPQAAPIEDQVDFSITDADTISFLKEGSDESAISDKISDDMNPGSSLFDMVSSEPTKTPDTTITDNTSEVQNVINMNAFNSEARFHDTAEFIDHTIGGIDELLVSLDAANDAKIAERDGYKKQKEQFAILEENAESEHQKMLIERAHAKKMKTYLEHEKAKTEAPAANDEKFTLAA